MEETGRKIEEKSKNREVKKLEEEEKGDEKLRR
jgi:hypothetical protein